MTGKNVFQENSILDLNPSSKSELLQTLSAEAARRLDLSAGDVLKAIEARESLGTTALGRGIGLPHTRLPGLEAPLALLARLRRPIDFEARDGEPVDLVFFVLWPENAPETFLPALSDICKVLREPQVPRGLRQARSPEEAMGMLREAGLVGPAPGRP